MEYSQKCIDQASTIAGICCKNGVILGVEKLRQSELQSYGLNKRIFKIENNITIAICGRVPDGLYIVQRAQKESKSYRKSFGKNIPGNILSERLSTFMNTFTIYGQLRPLGVVLLLAYHD